MLRQKANIETWKDRLMKRIGMPKVQDLPSIEIQVKGKLGAHKTFNDKLLAPIKNEISEIEKQKIQKQNEARIAEEKKKTDEATAKAEAEREARERTKAKNTDHGSSV